MSTQNKEEIYDNEISPLMGQIIAICQREGIAMLASYSIPNDEDDGLKCTTHLGDGDGNLDPHYRESCALIQNGHRHHSAMMITTTNTDGSKILTAVL